MTDFCQRIQIINIPFFKHLNKLYKNIRRAGLIAINLDEGDELLYVLKTDGSCNMLLATHNGLSVYFDENDARPLGRGARGVRAITLAENDFVVGAVACAKDETRTVLTITENGLGKRTELAEFSLHNRGGKGMKNYAITAKTGLIAGIAVVDENDDIMIIEDSGVIIRMAASDINVYKRDTQGVIAMRVEEGNKVIALQRVEKEEEPAEEESE